MKQKIALLLLGLVAGLILGAAGMAIVKQPKSTSESSTVVTLEGKILCLPHKNTNGPQTLECASGLRTSDKTYSLTSSQAMTDIASAAGSEKIVRIHGTLKSENETSIYKTDGAITVSSYEFLQ